MLSISIVFLTGVLVLQWCSALPPVWVYSALVAALPLLRWKFTRLPAVFIIGFFWAALRAEYVLLPELTQGIEGRTVLLEGKVIDMPRPLSGRRLRFLFAAGFSSRAFERRVMFARTMDVTGDLQPGKYR